MRLGQTSIIFFVSRLIGSVLGFVATIYFARLLGEEVLGFYAVAIALVSWLTIAGEIGISGAIKKRISEGEEQGAYATAGGLLIGILAAIVALVIMLFRGSVNEYIGVPVAELVILIVFVQLVLGFVFSLLQGSHLVHVYAVLSTTKQGLLSAAQIVLVFVGWGLVGMLVGYAVGGFLTAIVAILILKIRPKIPKNRHFVRLVDYAKYSWLGGMKGKTFDWVDIIVLGFFVPTGLIGIYSVAWSIGRFLEIFGRGISTTLFPEMSEIATKNDPSAVSGLTEDALRYAGLILIPGLVGGFVVGDRLLQIYGDGFVAGETVLVILISALLVYTYNQQLLNTLNAIDRPDLAFRSNAIFIGSNLIFNLIFVYAIGWIGAAIATTLSAVVGLVFAYHYTKSHVPLTVSYGEIARQWTAAIGMGLVIYATRAFGEAHWAWIPDYNAVFVVGLVGLGTAVYFTLLFGISREFRTTIANNLPFDVPLVES
ncbi:flippase [Halorubrum sp. DTA98]|uniref:flippase n=1 Tax=Halorubrum sp. DTA98 TaxID=3402163 RepID=UPI003AAEAFAD